RADLSALETRALVVLRRPQGVIDEYYHHNTNTIVHGRSQFGQGVHEAAITRDRHHRTLGRRDLGAQGSGKAKTQGGEVGRRYVGAWLSGTVGKMGPVADIGDATHQDGIVRQYPLHAVQDLALIGGFLL